MPALHTGGEVTTGGGDGLSAGLAGGVNNGPVLYTRVERDLTRYGMLSAYTPLRVCTACRQMMLEESRARGNGGWEDTC